METDMKRRTFLAGAASVLPTAAGFSCSGPAPGAGEYLYHGRVPNYKPFEIIERGLIIKKIETFTKGSISVVRITADDGSAGWGQISTYNADISALVLHRNVAGHFLGKDPADIDILVDRAYERNHKYCTS